MWEILHGTIKKMTKQVNQLQSEVDDARDRLDAAKRKVRSLSLVGNDFEMMTSCPYV